MNPDGSGITRLTNNSAADVLPDATRDGTKIVFASARDGNYEIYSMNADGTGQTRLTNDSAIDYDPTISPDGSKIAFLSTRSGNYDIWLMNANGSGLQNLTVNSSAPDLYASWSPDNGKLLFTSSRDGNEEIYVMNANGTGQTRLTNNTTRDTTPVFSPDGNMIAFQAERDGNREIYAMNPDGSGQVRLTNNLAADQTPYFSPDGTQLTFTSDRAGNSEIYTMKLDGTGIVRLTNSTAQETSPAWVGPAAPPPTPTLAINDIAVSEGNSGTTNVIFTVTLSSASSSQVTVNYATANGSATAGSDYTAIAGMLTFAPGITTKTIYVAVKGDITFEPNETFFVNLSAPTNATLADSQGQGTILNDDQSPGQLQFSAPAYSVDESGATATITVTRTGGSGGAVSVQYATSNGSATVGNDFIVATGTLNWANGDAGAKTFAVQIINDGVVEETELLNITLSAPSGGASLGSPATASLTITDDDAPPPPPPPGIIYFESNRDGGYRHIFRMNTDGSNITQLTFGSYNDAIPEASEDGTKIVFASDRSHPGGNDLDIYMMNSDGSNLQHISNMAGQEYDPSISPDKRSVTFQGAGVGGTTDLFLYDTQTGITRNLTNDSLCQANAAWGADGQTLIYTTTINGSDEIFLMKFDGAMNVTSRTQLTFDTTTRDFYPDISYDGTKIAWAKASSTDTDIYIADLVTDAGGNYSLANIQNLTHAPTTAETIPYFSPDDSDFLSFVSNRDTPASAELYTINLSTGVVQRLTNDEFRDLHPTWVEVPLLISVADVSVAEGNPDVSSMWTEMVFTVTLSRSVDESYQVNFTTVDGTALAGTDYQATSGTLTFDPGATTATVTVLVRRDLAMQPNRTLILKLSKSDAEGEFASSQAVGTILDDDMVGG